MSRCGWSLLCPLSRRIGIQDGTPASHLSFEAHRGPQVLDVARQILLGRPQPGIVFGEVLHQVSKAIGHGVQLVLEGLLNSALRPANRSKNDLLLCSLALATPLPSLMLCRSFISGSYVRYIPEASAFRTAQPERAATKEEGILFSRVRERCVLRSSAHALLLRHDSDGVHLHQEVRMR